jgi:hypothetical protein
MMPLNEQGGADGVLCCALHPHALVARRFHCLLQLGVFSLPLKMVQHTALGLQSGWDPTSAQFGAWLQSASALHKPHQVRRFLRICPPCLHGMVVQESAIHPSAIATIDQYSERREQLE